MKAPTLNIILEPLGELLFQQGEARCSIVDSDFTPAIHDHVNIGLRRPPSDEE